MDGEGNPAFQLLATFSFKGTCLRVLLSAVQKQNNLNSALDKPVMSPQKSAPLSSLGLAPV